MQPTDLNQPIPGAPSFKWIELVHSNTATARGIDNMPTEALVWGRLQYLAQTCLQPARDHFGIPMTINSGYRSPALNRAVGGSDASYHSLGCAADIVFADHKRPLYDLFDFFFNLKKFSELIAEELPNGWIHIALMKGEEEKQNVKYKLAGQGVVRSSFAEVKQVLGVA